MAVKFGAKGGVNKVSMPKITRPPGQFVLGSRPSSLRQKGPQIKPGPASTTQYGKGNPQADPSTAGFGDTDSTGGLS